MAGLNKEVIVFPLFKNHRLAVSMSCFVFCSGPSILVHKNRTSRGTNHMHNGSFRTKYPNYVMN